MLRKLFIKNFALIQEIELEFKDGLTVITGETGAGKSILLNALGLILGKRAELDAIGNPEEKCVVEAEFHLKSSFKSFFEENDLDFDGVSFVRRELLPSGKSRAFINDSPVSNKLLKQLGDKLIDIHGQRDNQLLFEPDYRLEILDLLANNHKEKEAYTGTFEEWKEAKSKLRQILSASKAGKQELEFKKFQYYELEEAKLTSVTELEELEEKQSFFDRYEEIKSTCAAVVNLGEEPINILGSISSIHKKCSALSEQISQFKEMAELSFDIEERFKDLERIASRTLEDSDMDESEMALCEARLDLLNNLLSKYGFKSLAELISLRDKLGAEIEDLDFSDDRIAALEESILKLEKDLAKKASSLSATRAGAAEKLQNEIAKVLPLLNMEAAKISFRINKTEEFSPEGWDFIEIFAQLNLGSRENELQKIASGGELSRVMLALKSALSKHLQLPTLIFDEIDTGLGGETASKMGTLLNQLAQNTQLVTITHLAQIAAKGKQHFKVQKRAENNLTVTRIVGLSSDERLEEVARMISGEIISPEALANAKVLLN